MAKRVRRLDVEDDDAVLIETPGTGAITQLTEDKPGKRRPKKKYQIGFVTLRERDE